MTESRIFAVQPDASGKVVLQQVWAQTRGSEVVSQQSHIVAIHAGNRAVLVAYNSATGRTSAYGLDTGDSWLQPLESRIDLIGGPWERVDSFVLGNDPYLMTYRSDHGTFGFFKIASDLSASPPYTFEFPRNWPTKGFTTVAPFSSLGAQYVLGYDSEDGTVAIHSLSVVTSAPEGRPPLLAQNLWYHKWAGGWTRFVFFQIGGANFFFKINKDKENNVRNVNIDHIQDSPAAGTIEVGSYLQSQLPDAKDIDVVARIPWANGEPYLITYIASTGKTEIFRIYADCLGWTRLGSGATVARARLVVPYRIGDVSYVLFHGGPQ